jgi:murein DD-endopeptidase MepM/ murein hydrolase activator NlpD
VRGNAPGSSPLRPIGSPQTTPTDAQPVNPRPARPGEQREYIVRPGDTLSSIARQELGNTNRWQEIQKTDGSQFTQQEARRLQIGQSVFLPVNYKPGTGISVVLPPQNSPLNLPRTGAPISVTSKIDSLNKEIVAMNLVVKNQENLIRETDELISAVEKENKDLNSLLEKSRARITEIEGSWGWWLFPWNHKELDRIRGEISIFEGQLKVNTEGLPMTRTNKQNQLKKLDESINQLRGKEIELEKIKKKYGAYINLSQKSEDETWWENEINDGADLEQINNNSDPNGLGSIYRDLSGDLFGEGKYFQMSGAYISDEYRNETGGSLGYHGAIDIAAPLNTKVMAIVAGTVVYRNDNLGMLTIQDARGLNHIYVHLNLINLNKGQIVERGQAVGKTGNKATSSPHLHYEVAEKDFIMGALQIGRGSNLSKQDFRDRTRNPLKDYWEMKWNGMI